MATRDERQRRRRRVRNQQDDRAGVTSYPWQLSRRMLSVVRHAAADPARQQTHLAGRNAGRGCAVILAVQSGVGCPHLPVKRVFV